MSNVRQCGRFLHMWTHADRSTRGKGFTMATRQRKATEQAVAVQEPEAPKRRRGPRAGSENARRGGMAVREKYGPEFFAKIGALPRSELARKIHRYALRRIFRPLYFVEFCDICPGGIRRGNHRAGLDGKELFDERCWHRAVLSRMPCERR